MKLSAAMFCAFAVLVVNTEHVSGAEEKNMQDSFLQEEQDTDFIGLTESVTSENTSHLKRKRDTKWNFQNISGSVSHIEDRGPTNTDSNDQQLQTLEKNTNKQPSNTYSNDQQPQAFEKIATRQPANSNSNDQQPQTFDKTNTRQPSANTHTSGIKELVQNLNDNVKQLKDKFRKHANNKREAGRWNFENISGRVEHVVDRTQSVANAQSANEPNAYDERSETVDNTRKYNDRINSNNRPNNNGGSNNNFRPNNNNGGSNNNFGPNNNLGPSNYERSNSNIGHDTVSNEQQSRNKEINKPLVRSFGNVLGNVKNVTVNGEDISKTGNVNCNGRTQHGVDIQNMSGNIDNVRCEVDSGGPATFSFQNIRGNIENISVVSKRKENSDIITNDRTFQTLPKAT